jgi:FlaA1/EpsC-like NDP-sugar epimerase
MKKHEIIFSLIKIPGDFLIIFSSFFVSKILREVNDFIPWITFPKHIILNNVLFKFALFGAFLYILILSIHKLYVIKVSSSKIKETLDIILYSVYWVLFFSFFIYFWKWLLYEIEIPRLIIFFTFIIWLFWVILERIILNKIQQKLLDKNIISKNNILLINNKIDSKIQDIIDNINNAWFFNIIWYINKQPLEKSNNKYLWNIWDIDLILKKYNIDEILYIDSDFSNDELYKIWDFSRIYGIRYRYITNSFDVTKINTTIWLINKIPVIEIKNTSLDAWGRVLKRTFDIVVSFLWLILLSKVKIANSIFATFLNFK